MLQNNRNMFKLKSAAPSTVTKCTHCGDDCPDEHPIHDEKDFCCNGCQIVYTILAENGLGDYYNFTDNPGISRRSVVDKNYAFLDDEDVVSRILEFRDTNICKLSINLPQIHCASCIWLLENLGKLSPGILATRVNFLAKKATLTYDPNQTTLRKVVELLDTIGYPPELNLNTLSSDSSIGVDRTLYYKIGLAGFSFGNIMLLSFPEYLGFEKASVNFYLGYINILLAIPVLLYSGFGYLRAAYWTMKMRHIDIDIPIAIGMLTLFFRSVYEIMSQTGEGYLDSLAGFIFFLLLGKWFQQYTFYSISFERNYKSYFPISALVKTGENWQSKSLEKLAAGDILLIKNEEIIPGDCLLLKGNASVDYSFVTGESDVVKKAVGEKLYAGGKIIGSNIQVQLIKNVDQSYLTKLWDEDTFSSDREGKTQMFISEVGKYFTITIMSIAVLTLIYWLVVDISMAFNAFTAVLIVACPCALALAMPFSYGNILRLLGKKLFYLKNVRVIDRIQRVDEIVFDKTGTITDHKNITATMVSGEPTAHELYLIKSVVFQSNHPLSKAIFASLDGDFTTELSAFDELPGQGVIAQIGEDKIRLGSAAFIYDDNNSEKRHSVIVEINGSVCAQFEIKHSLRQGVERLVSTLGKSYSVSILSGDNDREKERLQLFFPVEATMIFNQTPMDKLNYIKSRQEQGHKVLMIGDGLNDAGALMQSDVGIVISEDSNNFTPACDAILGAKSFESLLDYLTFLKDARWIIIGAFGLALLYNVIGLYFAVRGELSPVVAAILMPVSSISVVIYGMLSSSLVFRKYDKK